MGETEEFNTLAFEKRLMQLKDTQECIQGLSSWCLKQREHHKKIVASWLNVLKRVKIEQRLVLFYLANDVIQYSKRKNYEFVESWGHNLQKATPLVREEKVRHKILRIFKIWEQRAVYDEEFLSDLTGLLSAGATKKTDDDPLDFQPQQLVNKIKQCTVLEADTDLRLKYIHESHLQLSDADALCTSLKERSNKDDVEKELNEGIQCVERYTQALQREIVAREALLALLSTGTQYYSTQRGEVKVVAYAYKNFGARVRALKRKLDELTPALARGAPSPPQRDEDVPSPGPDEDLDLPAPQDQGEDISYNIDQTFNTSVSADGSLYNLGLSSFLTSDNPMSFFNDSDTVSANRIEVINSRPNEKQDFDINSFLKTLVPNDSNPANSDNNSVSSATLSQKSGDALPGLDLLTPDSTGNPAPPTSFYGTMDDDPEPYHPELSTQWNNAWNLPPAPVPAPLALPLALPPAPPAAPRGPCADTPESPPPAPPPPPAPVVPLYSHLQDMPVADVDHRGILPPPPPPPVLPLLGAIEDVDHRLLPALPPPPPPAPALRHTLAHQDVDHRNLISLTHQRPRGMAALDPRPVAPPSLDQDYRVPPLVPPSDIVESVDMDLSEDEDQQGMYPNQNEHRRNNFNNNKVLVGGDNGKTNHKENHSRQHHDIDQIPPITNPLPPINSPLPHLNNPPPNLNSPLLHLNNPNVNSPLPHPNLNSPLPRLTNPPNLNSPLTLHNNPPNLNSPPPHHNSPLPLSNPFDNMPPGLKMNIPFKSFPQFARDEKEENSNDSSYDEDLRSRGLDHLIDRPQSPEFENIDSEYQQRPPFNNQRFPRNWGPRTFRPPFGHQMWPRNGPRPPNRWMGPRQRFW